MHYAAEQGHEEVVEWLFSVGASISDKDEVCAERFRASRRVC